MLRPACLLSDSVEAFDAPLGPPGSLAVAWGLLPGAPALTGTGLAPAGEVQQAAKLLSPSGFVFPLRHDAPWRRKG